MKSFQCFWSLMIAQLERACASDKILDKRSLTTITKVVPPGRGCSIALGSGWTLRFPQMWETRRRHFCQWGSSFALIPFIVCQNNSPVKHVFLHLSSTCTATQGGAASQFFIVCLQLLLDCKKWNWFSRFFSSAYLPKFHSKSCQWQPQVHTSLKHTFVAADLCVVTSAYEEKT